MTPYRFEYRAKPFTKVTDFSEISGRIKRELTNVHPLFNTDHRPLTSERTATLAGEFLPEDEFISFRVPCKHRVAERAFCIDNGLSSSFISESAFTRRIRLNPCSLFFRRSTRLDRERASQKMPDSVSTTQHPFQPPDVSNIAQHHPLPVSQDAPILL